MKSGICLSLALVLAPLNTSVLQAKEPPHTLVLPTDCKTSFSNLLTALVSGNCIITFASRECGVISFHTQLESSPNAAKRHVDVLDGTILLAIEDFGSTRAQMGLTVSWQESNEAQGTFKSGAQRDAEAKWYEFIFGILKPNAESPAK